MIEGGDEPMDINGYLGMTHFYRNHVKQTPITVPEFMTIIHANNKQ